MSTTESSVTEVIEHAVRAAVKGPSPHNTQPWRFETGPRHIDPCRGPADTARVPLIELIRVNDKEEGRP